MSKLYNVSNDDDGQMKIKKAIQVKREKHSQNCEIELSHATISNSGRRLIIAVILFIPMLFSLHLVIIKQNGISEVELLNDIMEKSKLVYTNSLEYARRNRNPNIRPGYILRQQGATATYPVVMIPGFITSGLELWEGEECARSYFRQKLWGSLPILVQSFFTDNECWRRHLSLNPDNGMDPVNIRLRSAQGFEAADWVMSTFWVWEKIIENLADVGYDASNMIMMPYDWRLSFYALEERDGYLTKLKFSIEAMVKTSGKKVVLTSHSMGSQIVLFFFKWVTTVEKHGGGGGGKDWVEKHIHSLVNIAGPILGVPKAVPALLSGEMKDTAAIMGTMGAMVERIFGRYNRKELWKTWGSLWGMLPKGGDEIWGQAGDITAKESWHYETKERSNYCNNTDFPYLKSRRDPLIVFDNEGSEGKFRGKKWTIEDTIKYLRYWGSELKNNSVHAAQVYKFEAGRRLSKEDWHDPTRTPLPFAPSLKMYCLYGVGIETERAYFYKRASSGTSDQHLTDHPANEVPFFIDSTVHDPTNNIKFGTLFSDGDVSVPLVSLGYMCIDGWKNNKKLNPSKVEIVTREYLHKEEFQVNDPMRGGPKSADHVDILGNVDTIFDLLSIVTHFNKTYLNEDKIVSDIKSIAQRINSRPKGKFSRLKQDLISRLSTSNPRKSFKNFINV